jgi:hypothetical protein
MIKRIAKWLPDIPDAVIPDDDSNPNVSRRIGTSDDAAMRLLTQDGDQETDALDQRSYDLSEEPLGPPRLVDPNVGSIQIGPLKISARHSLVLIFWMVMIFNVLLIFGVIIVALMKSGRL